MDELTREAQLNKLDRLRRALIDARITLHCAYEGPSTSSEQIEAAVQNHTRAWQDYHAYGEELVRQEDMRK